jgi:hypothetical protein
MTEVQVNNDCNTTKKFGLILIDVRVTNFSTLTKKKSTLEKR